MSKQGPQPQTHEPMIPGFVPEGTVGEGGQYLYQLFPVFTWRRAIRETMTKNYAIRTLLFRCGTDHASGAGRGGGGRGGVGLGKVMV